MTSVYLYLSYGKLIIIKERSSIEFTHVLGGQGKQVAPFRIYVWNLAFDVTFENIITTFFTKNGIITKKDSRSTFDIKGFVDSRC